MQAIIYCRVSSKEQTKSLSLPMQEATCREFCDRNGWKVERVFVERGESAKSVDRTELQRMLTFCHRHRNQVQVVVVYNLNRFARNAGDHHAVRGILRSLNITLRSTTERIDDSPGGKMVEGILATVHQFENDLRAERTRAGMREAAERGHPSGIWKYDPANPDDGFTQEGGRDWFEKPKRRCKRPCEGP